MSFPCLDKMFNLQNLTHAYGGTTVLNVASWQAEPGAQWLMLGPSGSGKTTLLHVLAGILRPTSGRVTVAGQDLMTLSASQMDRFRGKNVGLVLQQLHLIDSLSVLNNLLLAQYLAGEPQNAVRARAVLASLDLADKAHARPHALSHGQAQRVAVARAVVNRPKLLLADEPTSNLDDLRCTQVLDLLLEQAQVCGATLVIATHDQRIQSRVVNHYALSAAAA